MYNLVATCNQSSAVWQFHRKYYENFWRKGVSKSLPCNQNTLKKNISKIFLCFLKYKNRRTKKNWFEQNIHPFILRLKILWLHIYWPNLEKKWREKIVFYIQCGTLMKSCVNHSYDFNDNSCNAQQLMK